LHPNQHITVCKKLYHLLSCFCLTGLLLLVSSRIVNSQVQDTTSVVNVVRKHSPQKAIIFSLICPGLGQVYNKKYWKLPIIYGAGGAFAYFIGYNQLKYKKFRDAFINNVGAKNEDIFIIDGLPFWYQTLPRGRDYYRRYRDLSILGLGAIYFLNIVDAMVDAHFFYFDVSDNLTMRLEPVLIESPGMVATLGFRINLGF
jgi:hypothetical protein